MEVIHTYFYKQPALKSKSVKQLSEPDHLTRSNNKKSDEGNF